MSERADLIDLVTSLKEARVLCIGDVMLDHFRYGEVERISPEAPVPVLRLEREDTMLGGVGNVARNLAALGAEVGFVSVAGDDEDGARARALLADLELRDFVLVEDGGRRTSTKTRYLAGTQQVLRADSETTAPLAPDIRAKVLAAAAKALDRCQVLVLSDYGNRGLVEVEPRGDAHQLLLAHQVVRDRTQERGVTAEGTRQAVQVLGCQARLGLFGTHIGCRPQNPPRHEGQSHLAA